MWKPLPGKGRSPARSFFGDSAEETRKYAFYACNQGTFPLIAVGGLVIGLVI